MKVEEDVKLNVLLDKEINYPLKLRERLKNFA